nr:MAG TPA: hypothetical protein [Caudoviricetes sp.]
MRIITSYFRFKFKTKSAPSDHSERAVLLPT